MATSFSKYDYVKKQSIESEMCLLSSILLEAPSSSPPGDEDAIMKIYIDKVKSAVFDILSEDDFYDKRNAIIFKALKQIIDDHISPDFIILSERLTDKSLLPYLYSIIDYLPAPINLKEYAKIIKKCSLIRKLELIETERNLLIKDLKNESDPSTSVKIRSKLDELAQLSIETNEKIDKIDKESVIKEYKEEDEQPPILRCYGLLPEGYACVLAGSSGTGKTYIALTLAAMYILETKKPALVWLSEDLRESSYRIGQMFKNVPLWQENEELIKENLRYIEKLPEPLILKEFGTISINTAMLSDLKKYIRDFGFIVLDPLSNFYGQEENNNTTMRMFMNAIQSLVFKTDKIILLTHHTGKVKMDITENNIQSIDIHDLRNAVRGASSLIDATRVTLFVVHTIKAKSKNGLQSRYVVNIKSNVSKTGLVTSPDGTLEKFELPFIYKEEEGRNGW